MCLPRFPSIAQVIWPFSQRMEDMEIISSTRGKLVFFARMLVPRPSTAVVQGPVISRRFVSDQFHDVYFPA